MKIQAFAAFSPKESLKPFSYEIKELTPFEVLIKISHTGLCYTDLYMINNDWKRSSYPLVPGHEVVGKVVQKGTSSQIDLGKRVGVSWVKGACLHCENCLQGNTNVCPQKIGSYNKGAFGGFADHIVADSRFVYSIPDSLSSEHAAPLLCAGATMYSPFRRYNISAAHHVAILGIGGLGHLGLQFSKAFGCETTALSSSPSKREEAQKFGADHFHTLNNLPKNPSYHFILCTADIDLDWNQMLSLLKPGGSLCFLSRPSKGAHIDFAYLVSTQRQIVGSNNANRFHMKEMLEFCAKKKITPQVELMPLAKINEAIERLKKNEVRYRVVLSLEE